MFIAIGSIRDLGMTLLTNGAASVICLVWHWVEAITEKLPASMSGVIE